jgi:branched-chain amino acid transport system ATP-binding protein
MIMAAPPENPVSEATLISLEGAVVAFGALRAVDGVTMRINAGERRAIIGPNGAGKTTLFNAIAGAVPLSAGRIWYAGQEITAESVDRRARRGMARTFQITTLCAGLSVAENLRLAVRGRSARKFSAFGADRLTLEEAASIEAALQATGLEARRDVQSRTLSYGEQRQLEMAMALATRPRLLLLDEPAAGLSPADRQVTAQIIRDLPADLTLIIIEHDMDLVLGLVDTVSCLHQGRVLVEATPEAIRADARVQEIYLGTPHHA